VPSDDEVAKRVQSIYQSWSILLQGLKAAKARGGLVVKEDLGGQCSVCKYQHS
jgi:hypothetical protein